VTLSNDEFQERLVDYLYGELEGDELRAFEDHLRAWDEARRELATLQATLRTARDGLTQIVDGPLPARVRSTLLAAAGAQLRAAEPSPAIPPTLVPEQGAFLRWLRAPWLLPTLGVAAAVALVVFGKHSQAPSMQVDEQTAKPSEQQPGPSPASAPPSTATSESRPPEDKGGQPAADMQQAPAKAARSRHERARSQNEGFAVPPPAWEAKREQASGTLEESRPKQAPAASGAARKSSAAAEREAPLAQDKASGGLGEASGPRVDRRAAAERSESLDGLAEPTTPAPAARAVPAAPAVADDARIESANERQPTHAQAKPALAPDDLARRAQQHVTAQRWQLAAADYRELLRRFPNDTRVAAWRKQLVLATQALRGAR
jgi:hypothetical protein